MSYTHTITRTGNYRTEGGGTVWMDADWGYTVSLSINDSVTTLTETVQNAYVHVKTMVTGNDFYDGFGLFWSNGRSTRYIHPSTNGHADNFNTFNSDMERAFNQIGLSRWGNHQIVWCASGNTGPSGSAGIGSSRTIAITSNMINPDGSITNFPIISSWSRWLNWVGLGDVRPYGYVIDIESYNDQGASFKDLDWGFIPWAISKSGVWKSCSRKGGDLKKFSGGSWHNVRNSLYPPPKNACIMKSNNWRMCPKIGQM